MNLPRVTSILAPYCDFSKIDPDVLDYASDRGTRTHAACLAYAVGLWTPVTDDIAGYVESYKEWHNRYVVEVLAVEKELIHPAWGYVGHCDLIAIVSGYKKEPVIGLLDLKTPVGESPTWMGQLAAYREVEQLEHKEHVYAGVLQLRKDGKLPKMTWLEQREETRAFAAFCAALSAHNYFKGAK